MAEPGRLSGVAEPVIAVLGPTAAGKSELALRLAGDLGGEIINADSMQLYAGMDIGTAKLAVPERRGIPHHLLDVWDVRHAASVAEYQRLARAAIAEVTGRGRVPILVGGSGLYLRAALDELDFPGTDPAVRDRLEQELDRHGPGALHARLAELDPDAARGILPSNGRRIVRALEVIEVSGRPFTATLPRYESVYPAVQLGLRVPRAELDERIAGRVDRMWQAGSWPKCAAWAGRPARGPDREPRARLRAGAALAGRRVDRRAARDETIRATRRFARRQEAWFRRDPRVTWLDAGLGADRTGWRWLRSAHAVRQGAWHRERLRDPARPRQHHRSAGQPGRPAVRPARPGWAPTGCCAWCAPPSCPTAGATRRNGSWTTATRTAASRRCAATASGCSPATCSSMTWPEARPSRVATRAGIKQVRVEPDGRITVDMGPVTVLGAGRAVLGGAVVEGLRISVGNPHLAFLVDAQLDEFDLSVPPGLDPADFPDGGNVELIRVTGSSAISMRVHERGSGETRSCGTGAVAAAAAAAARYPAPTGPGTGCWQVTVPGGELTVRLEAGDELADRPGRDRRGRRAGSRLAGRGDQPPH